MVTGARYQPEAERRRELVTRAVMDGAAVLTRNSRVAGAGVGVAEGVDGAHRERVAALGQVGVGEAGVGAGGEPGGATRLRRCEVALEAVDVAVGAGVGERRVVVAGGAARPGGHQGVGGGGVDAERAGGRGGIGVAGGVDGAHRERVGRVGQVRVRDAGAVAGLVAGSTAGLGGGEVALEVVDVAAAGVGERGAGARGDAGGTGLERGVRGHGVDGEGSARHGAGSAIVVDRPHREGVVVIGQVRGTRRCRCHRSRTPRDVRGRPASAHTRSGRPCQRGRPRR